MADIDTDLTQVDAGEDTGAVFAHDANVNPNPMPGADVDMNSMAPEDVLDSADDVTGSEDNESAGAPEALTNASFSDESEDDEKLTADLDAEFADVSQPNEEIISLEEAVAEEEDDELDGDFGTEDDDLDDEDDEDSELDDDSLDLDEDEEDEDEEDDNDDAPTLAA